MELVGNTGKGDASSGRMLGCSPAGSEMSMASACTWCAARSKMRFHHEDNVLVRYNKRDVSVNGQGGMQGFPKILMVTARLRSD